MANGHREYWSKVARDYDRVVDLQIGPRTREMVRQRLAREGRLGDVAELGCGSGFYTAVLAEKADNVVATDIAPGMLELARERVAAPNVRFQTEDCQRTSLPDAAFDTVFMSLLIHFTEPPTTVAEIRRLLKPGGRLIISNLDPRALQGSRSHPLPRPRRLAGLPRPPRETARRIRQRDDRTRAPRSARAQRLRRERRRDDQGSIAIVTYTARVRHRGEAVSVFQPQRTLCGLEVTAGVSSRR